MTVCFGKQLFLDFCFSLFQRYDLGADDAVSYFLFFAQKFGEIIESLIENEDLVLDFLEEHGDEVEWD